MTRFFRVAFLACGVLASSVAFAQLTITPQQTAQQIASAMLGPHVTITNPVLTCPALGSAIFVAGPASANLGMSDGAVFTNGRATILKDSPVVFPNNFVASWNNSAPGDADINALVGANSFDACKFECDIKAAYDSLLFEYVFGSEEYEYYSCSSFNDGFGFFLSGPGIAGSQNLAVIPGTTIPVTINSTTDTAYTNVLSIAACQAMGPGSPFSQYYNDNSSDTTLTYFGLTTVFQAYAMVDTASTYHLKIVVADVIDRAYDSGVFIKGSSITSRPSPGFPNNVANQPGASRAAVMPNPFNDAAKLRLPAAWKSEEVCATLTDLTGRPVQSITAAGAQLEKMFGDHTAQLSSGLYLLHLSTPRIGSAQVIKLEKL